LVHEVAMTIGMTLEQVEARMGSREWTRWRAFKRVRPFGEEGADLRAGVVACAMANLWSKRQRVPLDFMPVVKGLRKKKRRKRRVVSQAELKAKALALVADLTGAKHGGR